jgi:hypothetical protein
MNAMVCTPGPVLMLEPAGVVHTTLEWVPVASAHPDALETVLLWADGEWYAGYWDGAEWIAADTGGTLYGVSHWARVGDVA